MKIINKKDLTNTRKEEKLMQEIEILKALDHPNILKLYESFYDEKKYYLITEYYFSKYRFCNGGDLFEHIMESPTYDEKYSANVMKNILMAVTYLHELGIIHRDLKPENILLENNKDDSLSLKLIDFGTAIYLKPNCKLSEKIGTVLIIYIGILYSTRSVKR